MGAGTAAANTRRSGGAAGAGRIAASDVDGVGAFRANRAGLSGAVGAQVVRRRGRRATAVDGNESARGAEDVSPAGLFARDDDETRTVGGKYAACAAGSSSGNFGPAAF